MRLSNMILGLFSVSIVGAASIVGCSSDTNGGNTGGSSPTTSSSGTNTTSSSASGGSTCSFPCCPAASCKAADTSCIGLVDNTGQTKFGLRMSELQVTAPAALTTGIVAGIVGGAVTPNNAGCNLNGSATFNWLIQFDTAASTIKTGGAKPVADATTGYSFVDETVSGLHLQPITYPGVKPDASGAFTVAMGQDLLVPIYLDTAGTSVVILPLKNSRLTTGTLSASQSCIGKYNAENLDVANSCLPDSKNKAFITGAKIDGIITLEDADTVVVSSLNQSLCVLLSQDPATYGVKDAAGVTICKRTGGMIDFQGDTCSMAGGTCKDAVNLTADFAASSVKINN